MNAHGRPLTRWWVVPVVVITVITGHLTVPYVFLHAGLSAAVVSGGAALMVAKHMGVGAMLLNLARARFRRRSGIAGMLRRRGIKPS